MRTAFLFPGQGAQSPGFLHQLPADEPVRRTLEEAAHVIEGDWQQLDTKGSLASTVAVQLGTLIAGVAYARLLASEHALPDAVAGLSVGAYAAAVISGSLEFADALALVRLRAGLMQQTFGQTGFGMLAVMGLGERQIRSIVENIDSEGTPVHVASLNAPTEIVLAGSDAALESVMVAVQRAGARARRLTVSVPSHGALLSGISSELRRAMNHVRLRPPRVPYIGNCRGRALVHPEDIGEDLIENVSHTVRWHESVTLLYEFGCRLFIEMPPGRALTGLVKQQFSGSRALAALDHDFASIVLLVKRAPAERSDAVYWSG
jgi:malonate decarboxylase epsilon subunit